MLPVAEVIARFPIRAGKQAFVELRRAAHCLRAPTRRNGRKPHISFPSRAVRLVGWCHAPSLGATIRLYVVITAQDAPPPHLDRADCHADLGRLARGGRDLAGRVLAGLRYVRAIYRNAVCSCCLAPDCRFGALPGLIGARAYPAERTPQRRSDVPRTGSVMRMPVSRKPHFTTAYRKRGGCQAVSSQL